MSEERGIPGDAAATAHVGDEAREDAASPAARAGLDHVLAAERRAADLPEIRGIAPRRHERLGIVGGGTLGAGIATAALASGLVVVLVDRDGEAARWMRRRARRCSVRG